MAITGDEIRAALRGPEAALRPRPRPAAREPRCPACGGRNVEYTEATGMCRCRNCGHRWPAAA